MALFNSTTSVLYFGSVLIPVAVISDPVSLHAGALVAQAADRCERPGHGVAATWHST